MEINQYNFIYTISRIKERLNTILENGLLNNKIGDIYASDVYVLSILELKGPQQLQDIAKYASKDKSTVSSVVSRLEKNGYVKKERMKSDVRCVKITLTDKAKRVKHLFIDISNIINEKLYAGLSENDKSKLFKLIGKIYKNIRQ